MSTSFLFSITGFVFDRTFLS